MIRLEAASLVFPPGLQTFLDDLGDGENGFVGTTVHTGKITIEDYIQQCCDMTDPAKLPSGLVPQTIFWVLDTDGVVVGMVKLRHYLNEKLLLHGGHIGYFVRRDQRGKGYAKEALRLALIELRKLGARRALLTVDPDNVPSINVIERNGGRLEDIVTDPETRKIHNRYWIEIELQQPIAADDKDTFAE